MRVNFYSASIKSALISDTFENKQKKNKYYGSKCFKKLPKSSRNAKKKLVALSKVSLIRALLIEAW